jgi:hypothetical protein
VISVLRRGSLLGEVALLPVQFSRGMTLEKIPSRVAPLYPNCTHNFVHNFERARAPRLP